MKKKGGKVLVMYRMLRLTDRDARRLKSLIERDMKKTQRIHERSSYVPPEGKFDANLSIIESYKRWLAQLKDPTCIVVVEKDPQVESTHLKESST